MAICTDDADVKKHDQEITLAFEKLASRSQDMVDVTTINGTELKKTRCTLYEALNIIPDRFDYKNGCDMMLAANNCLNLMIYDNECSVININIGCSELDFRSILVKNK